MGKEEIKGLIGTFIVTLIIFTIILLPLFVNCTIVMIVYGIILFLAIWMFFFNNFLDNL